MRLITYEHDGATAFGRLDGGDSVVPMGADLVAYLAGRDMGQADLGPPLSLADVRVLAPIPRPGKILCVGRNYAEHASELDNDPPTEPLLFAKFANSVVADGATVVMPPQAEKVDWEAELGVVIGRAGRVIARADAMRHVAGYTCMNDLTARDLQRVTSQWTRGKAIDGFLPMGPHLVTADEIDDPHGLGVRCRVNGDVMQDGNTSQMIFDIPTLISYISETITLEPGDCIATGTPSGVGAARMPPRFLQPGDVVTVEVDQVGTLTTTMAR